MSRYQCCFCASAIERPAADGVRLTLSALGPSPAAQDLFAHVACVTESFAPALAPGVPFDANAFRPD